ncbi:hypothetical protein [Sorangium sp. So ce124]|uniref:hypothetical protein n=1 Tax=Sorangium sp. So ce124 TaxID=3133280 RepID=UPI003F644E30
MAISLSTIALTASGMLRSGVRSCGGTGARAMCAWISSSVSVASKGSAPVSIW